MFRSKRTLLKLLGLLAAAFGVTHLLINDNIADRLNGLNVQFNDLFVVNMPAPDISGQVISLGITKEEAEAYFANRPYSELNKIVEEVMAGKPRLALSTFLPHTDNVSAVDIKTFVDVTNKYPDLFFYSWFEPSDMEHWSRHPILKDLKNIFIPLTIDSGFSPYDKRMRRIVIEYTWNNFSYGQPLYRLLSDRGWDRKPSDFKSFNLMESRQAYLRYRGPGAYDKFTLKDLRRNPDLIKDKIVVFGPGDYAWEDNKYRAQSVYRGQWLSSRERISMIVDTLIAKDSLSRATDRTRWIIAFFLIAFYLWGMAFFGPVTASLWGPITILLWILFSTIAYTVFDEFLFVLEAAAGIGLIHFFASPALLLKYLRAQDRKAAEQQKQIEMQNLRSTLVVKSARADMGLKIATQVAHDIRGPLGAIGIAAQMRPQNESDEVTKLLTSSVERLQRISDDLLKKFRTGEFFDHSSVELPLLPLLNELSEAYRLSWTRLQISVSGDANAAVTVADKTALERAFSNMINNSIEATAKQKSSNIDILVKSEGDNYVIHLADDGPGIPAEIANKLFQRGATFGKAKGSGLGLAQVRDTVESLGGTIQILPSPKGAHFKITLPKPQSRRAQLKIRKNVIVVEDNDSIRLHWQTRLTAAGAQVSSAASPEEFDRIRLTPDVTVITDLIFETSDRTGFNVLEQCKKAGCHTILCSSLGANAEIQQMAQPLADVVLTKNQFDLMTLSIDT